MHNIIKHFISSVSFKQSYITQAATLECACEWVKEGGLNVRFGQDSLSRMAGMC